MKKLSLLVMTFSSYLINQDIITLDGINVEGEAFKVCSKFVCLATRPSKVRHALRKENKIK